MKPAALTPKYRALRELLAKRTGASHAPSPGRPACHRAAGNQTHRASTAARDASTKFAEKPNAHSKPISMEDLNQAYGFVDLPQNISRAASRAHLNSAMPAITPITMVNGKTVGKVVHRVRARTRNKIDAE